VVRLAPSLEAEDIALHVRNARFVHDVGGVHLQVVDQRPEGTPTPEDFQRMGRLLTQLGKRVTDLGVTLGYHNHMGNLGQSASEVASVLEASDERVVRLALDIAHWQAAGGDPVAAVRQYASRLSFLHLKDLQRPAPGGGPQSYRFVELGRGEVNVRGVLTELDRIAFSGWSIVELDDVTDPSLTPRDCARISQRYLESLGYRF
jgi:inosose dehydratase